MIDQQACTATLTHDAPGDRIEWLDFLRGLSAFAIVLFHVRVTLWIGARALVASSDHSWVDRATAWVTLPFPLLGSAVMLFFVVSGFAIHYPNAAGRRQLAIGQYALRRCLRIWPAYFAAVMLTVLAEYLTAEATGVTPSTPQKVGATAAMMQNYMTPAGQMVGNPSLWSLPVEVELYMAYPILLWLWRHLGTRWVLAGVAMTSMSAGVALGAGYDWPMHNFAKYWVIWFSGAILAEWMGARTLPKWQRWYGFLTLSCLAVVIGCRWFGVPSGLEHFVWGVIYFLVMLWGLHHPAFLARVPPTLRQGVLFLGRISYSLYLVHFPLFLLLGAGWVAIFGQKPLSVIVPLMASLIPIPAAYVLWRFVERPSQSLANSWSHLERASFAPSKVAVG